MLRKIIVLLLIGMFLFLLAGCLYNKSSPVTTNKESVHGSTQTTNNILSNEEENKVSNCTLLVNGKDITSGNYVKINYQHQNTELPLLAILEELGADIQWKDANTVMIKYKETTFDIDTANEDFGLPIPPGTTKAIRQIVNNEILIDGTSVQGLLNIMGAKIEIDYNSSVVSISQK